MLFLLFVATVSIVFAEEAQTNEEPKPAESVHGYSYKDGLELIRDRNRQLHSERYRVLHEHEHGYSDHNYDHEHGHVDHEYNHEHSYDHKGPIVLRKPVPLAHDVHIDIEAQNRIIEDVYSPDYHQPTWVLDYRYLKTGGRDYVRGPGGQILILPKGVRSNEHKEFPDFDAYLEHLRLSRLAEEQHRHRKNHHDDHHSNLGHDHAEHNRDHGHGHGQTMWRKY
ncbi:unnamed protein product [Arctia plantaginis]|uniref:Uncharacterized protein n=1 Tax=Arctia plantaginis TaxID=874455 RepID=A0A8S1A9N8_ARCPL|nr:unnamed protein product [Arctia plantaginis]